MRVLRRMEMEPESGSSWPERIRSRVDFPAPLGPIRPRRSPSEMPSEMFSNNGREPKVLEREVQLSSRAIYSYLSASTGSSCAALTAGQTPKKTPIATETVNPVDQRPGGHHGRQRRHQRAYQHGDEDGDGDAQQAAGAGERHGFHQELADDVAAARAHGLAHADFACALGDGDQHDVHDADTAHQQAQSRNRDGHQADEAGDVVELLDDLVGRGDGEIVFGAGGQTADAAHDAFHLLESPLAHAGPGLGDDHETVHLRVTASGGAQRDIDFVVLAVLAEESALGLGVDAGDGVLGAIHHEGAIHGMSVGEKGLGHAGADDGHVGARAGLPRG